MITVTERASKEIKNLMEDQKLPDTYGIKVGVIGGGCSGLNYSMNFESEAKEGERVYSYKKNI